MSEITNGMKRRTSIEMDTVPIVLTEVSDNTKEFDSIGKASLYLGIDNNTVSGYVLGRNGRNPQKIIKSRRDNKLYVIQIKK